jgi:hypothetical protein
MSRLFAVAFRFVKADATSRKLGILTGNAVAALLIATLAALPEALQPGAGELDPTVRVVMAVVLAFVMIPVFMLLASVGRVSAATRDRRLAALRLLGLSPARTLAVAMIENAVLALTGAVAGVTLFALLAPAASAAVRTGPRWFVGTLTLPFHWLVAIAVGVGLFSAILAAAPARRLRTEPKALRQGGTRTKPGWWRLAVFVAGASLLVWIGTEPRYLSYVITNTVTVVGVAAVVIGLTLSVPLFSNRMGRWLARSRRTVPMLAGRGILAEPSSGTRLVLGLGAVVFLTVAGAQALWSLETSGPIMLGRRVLGEGPQLMRFYPDGSPLADYGHGSSAETVWAEGEMRDQYAAPVVTEEQRRAISDLTEVKAVVGHWSFANGYSLSDDSLCDVEHEFCFGSVFIGSCADLAVFNPAATNCSDSEVRWMAPEPEPDGFFYVQPRPETDTVTLRLVDPSDGGLIGPGAEFALSDQAIGLPKVPHRDQGKWWQPSSEGLFIPYDLAVRAFGQPPELRALASGGIPVSQQLEKAAGPLGLVAAPEILTYYRQDMVLLTGFWALYGLAISVAVINLAITGIDRAKERRLILARQFALGVPGRVLRRAQGLQVVVPLAGAVLLGAIGGGAALVRYGLPDWRSGLAELPWTQLGSALGATILGAALVVALTIPLTRTRLTPETLRWE